MATTSGTVATYSFNQRKIIEHAARRALIPPEKLGSEALEVAQDLIFTLLSEYVNAGFPLWTKQFGLLGTQIGSPDVLPPAGTVDVMTVFWRILMPWRGSAADQNGNNVSQLFSGAPGADVVITGPNPTVGVNFASATEVDTIGVLLGGSSPITTALNVLTSTDGVNFNVVQTLPSATYTPGQWTYFDLDPSVTAQYVQVQYVTAGSWTLNALNFGLANGQDIQIGPLNIDDYYNLPNKFFQSDRANSAYVDRNSISGPTIRIWPTPDTGAFYNGTISALSRRYIQDPGSLTNNLEIPIRWYEGMMSRLGTRMMLEIPDSILEGESSPTTYFSAQAKQARYQLLDGIATKSEAMMWAEERNKSPIRTTVNISGYTR